MADTNGIRVRIGRDHYHTDITAGTHALVADEPEGLGGTDHGTDPYALLLASIGACKAITVRMYADRKQWPLEALELELTHDRVHANDCDDCEAETGMVSVIECTITAHGDLSDEQRARLKEIADKCPVHKTITGPNHIRTTLSDG
ncbi:MAG: OsmC family protein [Phycisphaerales bacterium]|nr:OsmC family protein [Phycisphaerales bacterium]